MEHHIGNSMSHVYVPAQNKDNATADGATFVRSEGGRQVYTVDSGKSGFTARPSPDNTP